MIYLVEMSNVQDLNEVESFIVDFDKMEKKMFDLVFDNLRKQKIATDYSPIKSDDSYDLRLALLKAKIETFPVIVEGRVDVLLYCD